MMKYLGSHWEAKDRRLRERKYFLKFACSILEAYISRLERKRIELRAEYSTMSKSTKFTKSIQNKRRLQNN
jgi:hypothetical protein